jgi:ribosome-associated protein
MPDYTPPHDDPDALEPPSKSELKRRMTALQHLGEALTALSDKQLQNVPIEDARLLEAIHEAQRISSNSARRRHLQFIGKLMRDIDAEPIAAALSAMDQEQHRHAAHFKGLEQLRDRLLKEGPDTIGDVVERWPATDRQHLRNLLLQAQREQKRGQAPAAARKLFRYLRELSSAAGEGAAPEAGDDDAS